MQLSLFSESTNYETIVNSVIGGSNGINCRIIDMVEFERENKYLIEFPNGNKFWTNGLAIIKI